MEQNKHAFYPLTVKEIVRETALAVSVYFDIPQDIKTLFEYKPGQYITLKTQLNNEEQRRAYSLSTSPIEERFGFTSKEVPKGVVSTYLNQTLSVGDTIEVMAPQGRFVVKTDVANSNTYYLFAAGSGITPVISMIKSILEEEGASTVHLLYGNKTKVSTIFLSELEEMAQTNEGALTVDFTYTEEEKVKSSFWNKADTLAEGRIDGAKVRDFLKRHKNFSKKANYYICGPNQMIDTVEEALKNEQIAAKNIHLERFTIKEEDVAKNLVDGQSANMVVTLEGKEIKLSVKKDQKIMNALIEGDFDPPYSCKTGTCSSCMAKVTKGSAEMEVCYALDDEEVEEGFILTCQAKPTTTEIELTFDID